MDGHRFESAQWCGLCCLKVIWRWLWWVDIRVVPLSNQNKKINKLKKETNNKIYTVFKWQSNWHIIWVSRYIVISGFVKKRENMYCIPLYLTLLISLKHSYASLDLSQVNASNDSCLFLSTISYKNTTACNLGFQTYVWTCLFLIVLN